MAEERIKARLLKLDECIRLLEERQCFDIEKFKSDPMLMDSVERRLQLAVEISKDIVIKDILRDKEGIIINAGTNPIQLIRGKGILSEELISKLIPTVNFRNRIVYDYLGFDPEIVFEVQHYHLKDVKDFITEIIEYYGWSNN
jgi:uncharacterized protein YutE (UPF0331/DUF86 family)